MQAEIDNAALYDELFSMVDNADLIQVFTSLQRASETRHLPAFERCALWRTHLPTRPRLTEPGAFLLITPITPGRFEAWTRSC